MTSMKTPIFPFVTMMACLVSFAGGIHLENTNSISNGEISKCAQGQNLSLRDTAGTAIYTVRFKDGEAVEIKCTKPAIK